MEVSQVDAFLKELYGYYANYARSMPWRLTENDGTYNPYKILVSEIMLQQTQVDRVIPKFEAFLIRFPDLSALAQASLADVLDQWIGLGYNRRAKYLHDAAVVLQDMVFPADIPSLVAFKGVGYNTAAAVLTYAFDQKHVFIETNVRTVLLRHFFRDRVDVPDSELERVLADILKEVEGSYREFYWALMDYGSHLKRSGAIDHIRSAQYKKQSRFEGSVRQLRGELLRRARSGFAIDELKKNINDERIDSIIAALKVEGLIEQHIDGRLYLYGVHS